MKNTRNQNPATLTYIQTRYYLTFIFLIDITLFFSCFLFSSFLSSPFLILRGVFIRFWEVLNSYMTSCSWEECCEPLIRTHWVSFVCEHKKTKSFFFFCMIVALSGLTKSLIIEYLSEQFWCHLCLRPPEFDRRDSVLSLGSILAQFGVI